MPSSSMMDEDHKRKRDLLLNDVPESIRGVMRRKLDEKEVDSSGGIEMVPEEKETMCVAFLAERLDTYTKRNRHTELNPQKMKSQLPQFSDKEIEEAMQKAVEKEIGTWQRFDAIDIVPPEESNQIRKNSPEKVISPEECGRRRTMKREMNMKRKSLS